MKCAKCGKKLKNNEKFCTYCGYYNDGTEEEVKENIIEDPIDDNWYDDDVEIKDDEDDVVLEPIKKEQPKKEKVKKEKPVKKEEPKVEKVKVEKPKKEKPVKEIKIKETDEIYDENERYIEAYIGEDYKLIKKSPFNIWAFLLNWMYFLYRKLYITGIIGLILTAVVAFLFTKYFIIYIIVTLIVLGIGFNPYYQFIVKRRVNKILVDYEGTDSFSLEKMCSEFGGVNVPMALIIYLIFLAVIVLSILKPTVNTSNTKFFKENSENEANCSSIIKLIYQGVKTNPEKIKEAVCKVNKDNKNYDIYLKADKENKIFYIYYTTENDYIVYKNNTESIDIYKAKQQQTPLTADEEKNLNEMKLILENYEKVYKKAKEEDKLIEENKDKEEKLNYIFEQEEIMR